MTGSRQNENEAKEIQPTKGGEVSPKADGIFMTKNREDPLQRFTQLKGEREKLQGEKSRLEGKLERVLSQLQEEFQCNSLEEGRELSSRLKKEEEKLREKFTLLLEKYEKKWNLQEE